MIDPVTFLALAGKLHVSTPIWPFRLPIHISCCESSDFLTNCSAGVEVTYYASTSFMHAKYIQVDGKKASVSSVNWSRNSFMNNREVCIIYFHARLCVDIMTCPQGWTDYQQWRCVGQCRSGSTIFNERVRGRLAPWHTLHRPTLLLGRRPQDNPRDQCAHSGPALAPCRPRLR